MSKVPAGVVKYLAQLPERDVAKICYALKITNTKAFKDFASKSPSKTPCVDFFVDLFTNPNQGALASIYHSVEGALFVGGCAPGIGIAFNIIDACFCIALSNWLGAFIAIISCFPIPGFKLAGKGFEKLLVAILKRISPAEFSKFLKMLGGQLSKIGFHAGDCYKQIGKKLEEIIPELNNPFASEIVKLLAETVKKMCKNDIVIKNAPRSINKYMIKTETPLLSVTRRNVRNFGIE